MRAKNQQHNKKQNIINKIIAIIITNNVSTPIGSLLMLQNIKVKNLRIIE